MLDLHNEPCACPVGQCAHFLENDDQCVNRLTGEVRVLRCGACKAGTWHQDGKCLRCEQEKV